MTHVSRLARTLIATTSATALLGGLLVAGAASASAASYDRSTRTFNDVGLTGLFGAQGRFDTNFPILVAAPRQLETLMRANSLNADVFTATKRTVGIGKLASNGSCTSLAPNEYQWEIVSQQPSGTSPQPLTNWIPTALANVAPISAVIKVNIDKKERGVANPVFTAGDRVCMKQTFELTGPGNLTYRANYVVVSAEIKQPEQATSTNTATLVQEAAAAAANLGTQLTSPTRTPSAAVDLAAAQAAAQAASQAAAQLQAEAAANANAELQAEADRLAAEVAAAEAALAEAAAKAQLELDNLTTTQGALAAAAGFDPLQAPVAGTKGTAEASGVKMVTSAPKRVKKNRKFRVLTAVVPDNLVGVLRVAIVQPQADGSVRRIATKSVVVEDGAAEATFKLKKKVKKGSYQVVTSLVDQNGTGVTALRQIRVR